LGNTVPDSLLYHLSENWPANQEVDVEQFFYDYTEQVGFPMLVVRLRSVNAVTVQQDRFLLDYTDGSGVEFAGYSTGCGQSEQAGQVAVQIPGQRMQEQGERQVCNIFGTTIAGLQGNLLLCSQQQ